MKSVKYVPSQCKGDAPEFSGEVEIRLPTFDEKYEYFEASGVEVNEKGEMDIKSTMTKIKLMRGIVKMSAKHYLSVSLKKNATGEEYKSFEDMSVDPDCHPIMIEVGTQLLNGFKLGN